MEENPVVDMLTLAQSVIEKKSELSDEGKFKNFFCSSIEDDKIQISSFDSKLFFQLPKFDPKTWERPIQIVKPIVRTVIPEEDQGDDHWTGIARDKANADLSLADTWENLRPTKCPTEKSEKNRTGKLPITETNDSESVHLLWALALDKLALVSNSGDEKPKVELISEEIFTTHLIHLMSGMDSTTFAFNNSTKSFAMRRPVVVKSVNPETLLNYAEKFIQMGNNCRHLEAISNAESNKTRGQTYQGLVSGLKSFLHLYRTTIKQVTRCCQLLELKYVTQKSRRQLIFVENLFQTNLPEGIPLLVYLCERSLPVNTLDLHHLSVFLFRSAAQPFFRFLSRWAFQGKLDESSFEFGMRINQADLSERSRRFWTHAFTHASHEEGSDGFGFLTQLLPMIATCGKTINFLKLNTVTSELVSYSSSVVTDPIDLIMSPEQEEVVKKKYLKYYSDFKDVCNIVVQKKKSFEITSIGSFECSSAIDENTYTIEGKITETYLNLKFDQHIENKYPTEFKLFESEFSDILSKVRHDLKSDVSTRPCFTPLIVLMEKSVLLPLRSQCQVLNEKGVQFLLWDSNLYGHLRALRHYLFFGDAEFSRCLCSGMFREMESNPELHWGPGQLSSIIETAISSSPYASKDPLSRNVSFYLDESAGRSMQKSSLRLSYKADWPVNIILTEEVLTSYGLIFNFLLQIYRCTWGLQHAFMKLKTERDPESYLVIQNIHLMRHQMSHFVLLLDSYVKSIIIEQSWMILKEEFLTKVKSIDSIYDAHTTYINRIMFRCFLNKKAEIVKRLMSDTLNVVWTFCQMVIRGDWRNDSGRSRMGNIFKSFKDYEVLLSSVLWKLTARGYQQYLQDFLIQLDGKNPLLEKPPANK